MHLFVGLCQNYGLDYFYEYVCERRRTLVKDGYVPSIFHLPLIQFFFLIKERLFDGYF